MKMSESIINNLLIEVETLTYRLRNIKQSFTNSLNKKFRERLICENRDIIERLNEINRIAYLLNNNVKDEINFSTLLIEKTKRTLKETKTESNLFFL